MDDYLDEEMQIMEEQDQEGTQLSSEVFKLPISDLKPHRPVCLEVSASIQEAIDVMQKNKFGSVLVTENGTLAGIITERDILMKTVNIIKDFNQAKVTEIMTPQPTSLRMDDLICYVLNNMHVGGYRHVPIVDDAQKPIGIVSIKDVVSFILDHFPSEIINLLDQPYRGKSQREGA